MVSGFNGGLGDGKAATKKPWELYRVLPKNYRNDTRRLVFHRGRKMRYVDVTDELLDSFDMPRLHAAKLIGEFYYDKEL